MKFLFLITARGGSKGIPGKNIKVLGNKPLLWYSIDAARNFTGDENICLSTDNEDIIKCAESHGLKVHFTRPAELATDTAGSHEVILHAIDYFEKQNKFYDAVVLLQPTSPFRTKQEIDEALKLYNKDLDMVVSVNESHANPYYNLFIEDNEQHLKKVIDSNYTRRQDCPKTYIFNGSIYVMNVASLKKTHLTKFEKTIKTITGELSSIDIDTPIDWAWAEFLLEKQFIKHG